MYDGSVVACLPSDTYGGDSSRVHEQLPDIQCIYSARYAFADVKNDSFAIAYLLSETTAEQGGPPTSPALATGLGRRC